MDIHSTMSDDPAEIYTFEDFMAEQNILDSIGHRIEAKLKAKIGNLTTKHRSDPRKYINRNREAADAELVADYFAEDPLYSEIMFRRRFRMRRPLFLRIVHALGEWSSYFTQRIDCTKRRGLSPLQKCTAATRMLAYGTPADSLDEYLKVAETKTLECLDKFVTGLIELFGDEYLRSPTSEDMENLF